AKPMSDANEKLTGAKGVPWIQNWVKVTATCKDANGAAFNRAEAQFTKMPTSALWVDNTLEQNHVQEGLGDFIMNYPTQLAPLYDKLNKRYDIDEDDVCADTIYCDTYTPSFDNCPIIVDNTPVASADGSPCTTSFAETESQLGPAFERICFTDESGNG